MANLGRRGRGGRRSGTASALAGPERQIAYCGLYCGDCFWGQGRIMKLARSLRREVRAAGFMEFARYAAQHPWGRVYQDFDRAWKVLAAMTRRGCTRICRDGGCSPSCRPRQCCIGKGLAGCWRCPEFETCPELKALDQVHGDGHRRNLRIIRRKGPQALVKGPRFWARARRFGPALIER